MSSCKFLDISSVGFVPLRHIPDVIGLVGFREGAAESRVLQGRDVLSVRVLVPDCCGVDQNFHDVTIVDMGVTNTESAMASGGH